MRPVRAGELRLGDVMQDPATTRLPNPDGTSLIVRLTGWRPADPGRVAFDYEICPGQSLAGRRDWAEYAADAEVILFAAEPT